MEVTVDIGRAIREIAESRGLKQVDICERAGISDAHMSQIWRSKKYDMYASVLYKISLALGVDANDVFELACKYPHPKDPKPMHDTEH